MLQGKKSPDGNFSTRMESRMKALGFSGAELSRQTGIAAANISRYIKGRIPAAEELLKISQILDVTMEWLLIGDEFPKGDVAQLQEEDKSYRTEMPISVTESMKDAIVNLGTAVSDLQKLIQTEGKNRNEI